MSKDVFQFYVDDMPDWFMSAVSKNEVTLHNCDYKRYGIEEAHCRIRVSAHGRITAWGGDYIGIDEYGIYVLK